MKIQQIADRLSMDLGVKVLPSHLRYYDKISLISIERNDKNHYREFSQADYAKLVKAVMLTKLRINIVLIDEILNKKNEDIIHQVKTELGLRRKWISILEEVL